MTQRLTGAAHAVDSGDGRARLTLSGELDIAVVAELDSWLTEAAQNLPPGSVLTIDLSSTTFCDAGCTAILTRHYYRLTALGVRVRIDGVHGMVAKVFALLGLSELLSG